MTDKASSPHPLAVEWVKLPGFCNLDEPWMAFGYQRATEWIARRDLVEDATEAPEHRRHLRQLAETLSSAHTYLVTREIAELIGTFPLPAHPFGPSSLPFPSGFFAFQWSIMSINDEDAMVHTNWLAYTTEASGIRVFANFYSRNDDDTISNENTGDIPIAFGPLNFERRNISSILIATLAFLNSPYTATHEAHAPRAFRRHGALSTHQDRDRKVHVIELRQATRDAIRDSKQSIDSNDRNARWWVRGHIRSQWYPSDQEHRAIWIAPHLKGPQGAPILESVRHVVR